MEAFSTSGPKERMREDVDALTGESIDGVSTDELGADLIDIWQTIDRLEAEFVRRLHPFDRAGGSLADGVGTVSWLRGGCNMTAKAAAYRVHLARSLGELPATLDSARAGRASFANVSMIGRLAGEVGVEQVKPLEHALVGGAETLDPGRMRYLIRNTRVYIDPDGVLKDDNHAHERRWFNCDETYGGVFVVRGELDAEGGALLKTAIDALSHGMARGEERSASQRRADALVDMAATQLRCGDHRDVHGQRPHLTLTVSAATLASETKHADVAPPELGGVGPIHSETARRIACDAVRTEVTVAAPPEGAAWMTIATAVPLSVGRATRTIPAHIRTALTVRDHGCRFPGCDRPSGWTDGHHIIHWADGGPTELENLVSLCRTHHRRVHEEGWQLRVADGMAVVEPPP